MKLALGTAQFGMQYGIANQNSSLDIEEISEILRYAKKNDIDTLDTAIHYGQAERRLGLIGVEDWKIITKLHSSNLNENDPLGWAEKQIETSLENLKIQTLAAVLIHDGQILQHKFGALIWKKLNQLKEQGLIASLGLSIYQPSELDDLYKHFDFDIVQAPLNVFDRRVEETGWMRTIKEDKKEFHARSIFLQGLLLMQPSSRPEKFKKWQNLWEKWENWLEANNTNALEASLNSSINKSEIDKLIVGIDSFEHLKEIISILSSSYPIEFPIDLASNDELLINPSNWDFI